LSITVWIVLAFLILANAFYVAGEFGAVGVRRSRVRRLSDDGSFLARKLLPFVQDPGELDRYVAVSQVGITLSSLILGAVAQGTVAVTLVPYLADWTGLDARAAASTAAIVVLIVLTAVQVLISELIPKSIALQFPTEVALATVLPMRWSLAAFKPLINVLNGSATALLRLLGQNLSGHRHLHSPDEIALLIAESRDGGLLEPEEHKRLHRALRLGRRTARDLMVPCGQLKMINLSAPLEVALEEVAASPFSRLPAYRDSPANIVGVLRVKDLVQQFVAVGRTAPVDSLLRPFVRVPAKLPGDQVIARLREKRTHQAAVVDDAGAILGFVSIHDALTAFLEVESSTS
jgi:CBS domain containing-hemolysin-like protein